MITEQECDERPDAKIDGIIELDDEMNAIRFWSWLDAIVWT